MPDTNASNCILCGRQNDRYFSAQENRAIFQPEKTLGLSEIEPAVSDLVAPCLYPLGYEDP